MNKKSEIKAPKPIRIVSNKESKKISENAYPMKENQFKLESHFFLAHNKIETNINLVSDLICEKIDKNIERELQIKIKDTHEKNSNTLNKSLLINKENQHPINSYEDYNSFQKELDNNLSAIKFSNEIISILKNSNKLKKTTINTPLRPSNPFEKNLKNYFTENSRCNNEICNLSGVEKINCKCYFCNYKIIPNSNIFKSLTDNFNA